jgi:hypothetical protein
MLKITPLIDTLCLQKISDAEYFSKKYSNYISNSRLSLINPDQDGSPEKFFNGFKSSFSSAFELGSGVHELILQGDLFEMCNIVDKPTAKMGALADKLYYPYLKSGEITDEDIIEQATIVDYYGGKLSPTRLTEVRNKCSQYWKDRSDFESHYKGNKEVLYYDPKSREIITNCVNALNNNRKVRELLYPTGLINDPLSETEQAILLDVLVENDNDKFKLRLKSKLDHYSIDTDTNTITVNDVKTIGKIVSEMENNIAKFHYNREIAMYSWLLSLCAKKFYNMDNPTVKGNYLVVSTIPQHYTKVLPMTKSMYREGWEEFRKLLKLVAINVASDYKDFGIWT